MRARNISSRVKARSKADMCEIRLAEFDEIVEARGEVANATEFRVTAGSSGNQTQVEIEDRRVTKGLKRLAKALEKQASKVARELAHMTEETRADMHRVVTRIAELPKQHPLTRASVGPTPATHSILTVLKAGEIVYETL